MGFTMGEKIRRASFTALLAATLLAGGAARAEDDKPSWPPRLDVYTVDWTPQQAAEWQEAQRKMRDLDSTSMSTQQKCEARWAITWPLAKSGNLEARYGLYVSIGAGWERISSLPEDMFSRFRTGMTLYYHSLGAPSLRWMELYSQLWRMYGVPIPVTNIFDQDAQVHKCLLAGATQECAKIAVKRTLIPSFETFAAEIDQSLKNGATISCPE